MNASSSSVSPLGAGDVVKVWEEGEKYSIIGADSDREEGEKTILQGVYVKIWG